MTVSILLLTENSFLEFVSKDADSSWHSSSLSLGMCWLCQGAWIRNPVLARLLQVIYSTEKPVSFPFALHLFPYWGVVCNKVFALCFRVFRKRNTYSSTSATVCMLWKNDYSSWSILKVWNDFCNSFECFTYLNTSFILGIYMRKIWAFGFHLGCLRHLWCYKLKSKKRSVIIVDSGWISDF